MLIAAAMKDWAIEKGATHYTHWFQPLTGVGMLRSTILYHISKSGWFVFDGVFRKELIAGEPDKLFFRQAD